MNFLNIKNNCLEMEIMDYGSTITSLKFHDRETLYTLPDKNDYLTNTRFICCAIGRYANRIGKASFKMEGKQYILSPNEGENQLHGGPTGFYNRYFSLSKENESTITAELVSPSGDNGFPGKIDTKIRYTLAENKLRIDFYASTDAITVFSPTQHMYFIFNNGMLKLDSDFRIEVDSELIPTGKLAECRDMYNYSKYKPIQSFLDDAFVLKKDGGVSVANQGYTIDVSTDMPAVQIYTGLDGTIAVEPEFYPDSPNHPDFPSTVLKQGHKFHKYIEYSFTEHNIN